jgi:hypothetical protein
MALEQNKRTLPPWLANVKPSPRLTFQPLSGTFVENHANNIPVSVTLVEGWFRIKAVIFRTPFNEDVDGHPMTYAPPISATNHSHLPGLSPLDHINNAIKSQQKPPTFVTFDPAKPATTTNSWLWAGLVSMTPTDAATAGRRRDEREFLRDNIGRYPIFNRAGAGAEDYYAARTAINTKAGDAVNPLTVPYAALSGSLKANGDARLGDFGLAIRASTGAASPFIYADSGGDTSISVGECSRKLIREVFVGPANGEKVCHIVFPGSRRSRQWAEPELMGPTVRQLIQDLGRHDNADELARHLAYPANWVAHRLPASAAERVAQESIYGPQEFAVTMALNRWGYRPTPPVPANKAIF